MPAMVITGASRGIGAATAVLAAASGYDVCIGYRSDHHAARSLAERCRAHGVHAHPVQVDVTDEAAVVELFARAETELGPLRCLVNNAGVVAPQGRLEDFSADRIRRVVDINVVGSLLCAREAVRRMSPRNGGNGGSIVNVSSLAAYLGSPNEYVDYAASKGAIDTMTIGLATEVAAEGIRVNAVRPGLINTDLHARNGDPERLARLAPTIPMLRTGEPDEVAETIVWLASDAASYVTGALLNCAGGR